MTRRENRMKAIAYEKYGSADVLELKEVRKPEIEGDRVLVRILAASANPYDWHFMRGVPYIARPAAMGVRKPNHTLLGSDVAGEVEAVGNTVTRFRPGDEVFGFVGEGGFAEYVSAPERLLALKPTNLSFELAGTTPPLAFRRVLTPKGRLVLSSGDSPGRVIGPVGRIIKAMLLSPFIGGQTMRPFVAKASSDDLQFLRELIEAGRITPVIDRTYPLSEAADAIRYLETGRARGKVVISVQQ